MSAYTTLYITRKKAIETMIAQLLSEVSNEQLESFMDSHLEQRLYNCRIVSDGSKENDDETV